eukprot:6197013-Pleurochrysis_carterae.AAC.2
MDGISWTCRRGFVVMAQMHSKAVVVCDEDATLELRVTHALSADRCRTANTLARQIIQLRVTHYVALVGKKGTFACCISDQPLLFCLVRSASYAHLMASAFELMTRMSCWCL